eukprot:g335.t1
MSSSSSSSEEEKEKIPFSELVKQWSEKIGKNERMNWSSRKYKIDDDDAKAIAEVLKTNTTLTSMDAFNKKITAVGAKAIAEALKTNKTLTDIRNKIGDEGGNAFAEVLKTNKTLVWLNMRSAKIGDDAQKAIKDAWGDRSEDLTL